MVLSLAVRIDTDKRSEFLSWHVVRWCARREILFTRGRPYKKDDNAHIEQKNWDSNAQADGLEALRYGPGFEA
jgi:transposase InsO family protein